MKRSQGIAMFVVSVAGTLVLFQNCSQVNFAPSDAMMSSSASVDANGTETNSGGKDPTCSIDYTTTNKQVKVLFVVDNSASNEQSYCYGGNGNSAKNCTGRWFPYGTDVDKNWRLATINNFLNKYAGKNNFSYSAVTFQGGGATALISSKGHGVFTSSGADVLNRYSKSDSDIYTPYKAGIDTAADAISYDQMIQPSKDVLYVVLFISDGMPTDKDYTDATKGMSNLVSDVNKLMKAAPGRVTLNTVFLYNDKNNMTSAELKNPFLIAMAQVGNGMFLTANSQQVPTIEDTVKSSQSTSCQ